MSQISIELKLKEPWVSPNFFSRLHFGAKSRLHQKIAAELLSQVEPLDLSGPLTGVEIFAHRVAKRSLDLDNLYGGLKPILDAMGKPAKNKPYGIGLIIDDRKSILKRLSAEDSKPSDDVEAGSYFMITGSIDHQT